VYPDFSFQFYERLREYESSPVDRLLLEVVMPNPDFWKRRIVSSACLPAPKFKYSPVVQTGPFVQVSGMVGLEPATGALVAGGAFSETSQILSNLKLLAEEQGWPLDQLLIARIFCSDFSEFPEINRAWEIFFAEMLPPARTSVGVQALPLGALVEIEFQWVVNNGQ
jgi:2-iminobutanoate/2-iminopropanoate deaminase